MTTILPNSGDVTLTVRTTVDDRFTLVTIYDSTHNPGKAVAYGIARRRKGDPRSGLGCDLAERRALLDLLERMRRMSAKEYGTDYFPPLVDHAEHQEVTRRLAQARRRIARLQAQRDHLKNELELATSPGFLASAVRRGLNLARKDRD